MVTPCKSRSHFQKWVMLEKKWEKMGDNWKNESHLKKMFHTWSHVKSGKRWLLFSFFLTVYYWASIAKISNSLVIDISFKNILHGLPVTPLSVAVEYDNARIVESNVREPMSIPETPCGVLRQITSLLVRSLLVHVEFFAWRLCTSSSLLRALRFVWSMEPTCVP